MPKKTNWTRKQGKENQVRKFIWEQDNGYGYVTLVYNADDSYSVFYHSVIDAPKRTADEIIGRDIELQRKAKNRATDWIEDNPSPKYSPPKMF